MPRLFVDNLTVIDCSLLHHKRGLIGASWKVSVELAGKLDEQSMVFDFSKVKKTIKQWIDNEVDHKLLVPCQYDGCKMQQTGQQISIEFETENAETIRHSSPSTAICKLDCVKIKREQVAQFIASQLKKVLPNNVEQVLITLDNENRSGAYYTYSHGLKKHDGNCQRIAHGHRSRIEIWKNGRRSKQLEKSIAKRWRDIYLGTKQDIREQNSNKISFAYSTEQGDFSLEIDSNRVHLMECDSTVECIAEHVLSLLETEHANTHFKVRAFEGINKGAIAQSDAGH